MNSLLGGIRDLRRRRMNKKAARRASATMSSTPMMIPAIAPAARVRRFAKVVFAGVEDVIKGAGVGYDELDGGTSVPDEESREVGSEVKSELALFAIDSAPEVTAVVRTSITTELSSVAGVLDSVVATVVAVVVVLNSGVGVTAELVLEPVIEVLLSVPPPFLCAVPPPRSLLAVLPQVFVGA